ncbi:MAG: hypothetical protein O7J95_05450 [Planctomycetota bacterium]|nr:hypothetical protein [Planctomycetota bacterium]
MLDWIREHETALGWLGAVSLATALLSVMLVPWIACRIPTHYFAHRHRRRPPTRHPLVRVLLLVAKTGVGVVLILAGIAMLVLPGQGLLTIALGLSLLEFPGRFEALRYLVRRRPVLGSLNWIRGRRGRPPLVVEAKDAEEEA